MSRDLWGRWGTPAAQAAKPYKNVSNSTLMFRVVAWLTLVAVVLVTIVPAELRPTSMLPLKLERALGFATLSFIFALAYARHWKMVLILLMLAAFGLELFQFLVPSRDPSIIDALVKAIGAAGGVLAAKAIGRVFRSG